MYPGSSIPSSLAQSTHQIGLLDKPHIFALQLGFRIRPANIEPPHQNRDQLVHFQQADVLANTRP